MEPERVPTMSQTRIQYHFIAYLFINYGERIGRISILFLTFIVGLTLIAAPLPLLATDDGWDDATTVLHQNWDGQNVIDLTEQLCNISAGHPAYRVAGSAGAEAAAGLIAQTFEEYGLEVSEESFEMPVWDLSESPRLFFDHDGDLNTDMVLAGSFNIEGFSLPVEGVKELATLPLPSTPNQISIGNEPIDEEAWSQVNTTGKVLLIGREVRWDVEWEQTFKDKLTHQTPSAIIFYYSYSWMDYADQYSQMSSGGRPLGVAGPYFWDLGIAVGDVNYSEGQALRSLAMEGAAVNISIPSSWSNGSHKNIMADIPSSEGSDKIVLLGAHYDTVMCEGYIDNTASVAALLETARVIQEAKTSGKIELRYNLRFVAFAGEEMGLVGSIHYVRDHLEELPDHLVVLVADCIGSQSLKVTYAASFGDHNVNKIVAQAAQALGMALSIEQMDGSDHTSFIYPSQISANLQSYWGVDLGLQSVPGIQNAVLFYSYPMTIYDEPDGPVKGLIHTPKDSISGVEDPSWVEEQDLKDQAEVFALSALIAAAETDGGTEWSWYYTVPIVIAVTLLVFLAFRWKGRGKEK